MLKKFAILSGFMTTAFFAQGQGAKFGLHLDPGFSFMFSNKPQISSAGVSGGLNVGLELEYYFMESEKVAFTFGVDFSIGKGGSLLYKYGGKFFDKSAKGGNFELATLKNTTLGTSPTQANVDSSGLDFAAFSTIKQTVSYVEIPFGLKLRPAEFGDWKIFLHVPVVKVMVPVASTAKIFTPNTEANGYVADLYGYQVPANAEPNYTKAAVYKDMFPIQVSVGMGVGAEWAPTDKLRVYAGIYYDASLLGITKAIKTRTAMPDLLSATAFAFNPVYQTTTPRLAPHTLSMRIGVLFVP